MAELRVLVEQVARVTESQSRKSPVAPQSKSAFTDLVSWVSTVMISTVRLREFADGVEATTYLRGSRRSHLGRRTGLTRVLLTFSGSGGEVLENPEFFGKPSGLAVGICCTSCAITFSSVRSEDGVEFSSIKSTSSGA